MFKIVSLTAGSSWPNACWIIGKTNSGLRAAEEKLDEFKENGWTYDRFLLDYRRFPSPGAVIGRDVWAIVWDDTPVENEFGVVCP